MQGVDEHLSTFHILTDEGVLLSVDIWTDDERRLVATAQGDGDDAVLVCIDQEVRLDGLYAVGSLGANGTSWSRIEFQYLALQQFCLGMIDVEPPFNPLPALVYEVIEEVFKYLN